MPIDRTTRPSSLLGPVPTSKHKRVDKTAYREGIPSSPLDAASAPATIAYLRQRLAPLVAHLDLADEDSIRQMREPVLKEVLLWEFGQDFRQDPGFLPTLESLANMLETQPSYQRQFSDLLRHLKL